MTNVTKSMLDQALKELEVKLVKEFNVKLEEKDWKFEKIKADLETKVLELEKKLTTLEGNKSPSISNKK